MTIGIVLDDSLDRSDGVQQAVLAVGDKLSQKGHEVHYIVSKTVRDDIKNIHSVANYLPLKFNGNSIRTPQPASGRKIRKLFRDVKFDALYVQMPFSPFLAGKVINKAPIDCKIVGEFHILPYNFIAKYGTYVIGRLSKIYTRKFSHFFAVSKPAKKFLDKSYGVNSTLLPNPVNYKFFNSFSRKNHPNKIVFVGRFEERKGVKQLVHAFEKMNNDEAELVLCGDGPMMNEIKSYISKKNLNVKLLGFVTNEQKAEQLAEATVAVFPSTSGESFGIVLTEAMSAGAGVTLGGNNPGYNSVLGDWPETLFNPDDIEEFTMKLSIFLKDEKLRNKFGKMQYEAVKKYDIEKVTNELLRYLK